MEAEKEVRTLQEDFSKLRGEVHELHRGFRTLTAKVHTLHEHFRRLGGEVSTPKPAPGQNDVCTLRAMVKLTGPCAQRFDEVERLAKSIFKKDGEYVPLPYFTEHGANHCKAVEEYLDKIIWGGEEHSELDFFPTPEEAMYLLSAVWLHDIGMMYKIFDGEDPQALQDNKKVEELRREHEFRTARYIHDKWKGNCSWLEDEKTWLSNICVYHRRHHPISTLDPIEIIGKHNQELVRLLVLAALLRLADACNEDQSRAPGRLMEMYVSLGMPEEAVRHWEKAKLIREVEFDHTSKQVVLRGHCPPRFDFELGEYDLGEIVEIVRQDVEKELQSVQKVLFSYPNTSFWEVRHEIHYVKSLKIHEEKQYLSVWPYLLDKASSSTEAAAALVQMLLFAVNKGEITGNFGEAWRNNTMGIMDESERSRPVDFMVRNLCQGVKNILSEFSDETKAKSAENLKTYLRDFLKEIRENCRKIGESIQELVGPDDVLVFYGYCPQYCKLMRNLGGQYSKALYIVEYNEPEKETTLGPDENTRMVTFANKHGFDRMRLVPLPTLAEALSELKRKSSFCKVLLGTHGVLRTTDNDGALKIKSFLSKVGSYTLASTAKKFDAQVIVFAEEAKFLINGESDKEVANPEELFSWETCKQHRTTMGIMRPKVTIDFLPKELIDLVVTEKGVFKPDAVPIPAEKVANDRASEKKESKPT